VTHEIIEGDCLDVMRGMADCSVDAIIADPPYGQTSCKWDSVIPFVPMWEQVKRIAKPRAAIVLFGSQPFTSALVMSNPAMFRHEWIWRKSSGSNFLNVKREPMKEHESVLLFGAGGWTYHPQMQQRSETGKKNIGRTVKSHTSQSANYGTYAPQEIKRPEQRCPSSVQRFTGERGLHPTQKPVPLLEYLIRTYTNEGDTVLDFTCGSGTTGVACVNTGRHFIGIEREHSYCDIARHRIADATAQPALAGVA
jgi:site-specific DNA-methyltransferase (adenine-specific)